MQTKCLVWLEWPEKCFCLDAEALSVLKSLVPAGMSVVRVKSKTAFLRELPTATHVITWHFEAAWYAKAKHLKLVATPAAGRELVAWQDAPAGVQVHFGTFHGEIIAESVVGFLFAWAHGFFRPELKAADARNLPWRENWPRSLISGVCSRVAGTQAVVVGYGKIGQAIGRKLSALGVTVVGFTRANIADLPQTAKTADWLILALPSDTGTDNLLDKALLAKLPKRCVVVNIGRGNAVAEDALVTALRRGDLAGAYLDVFVAEPGPLGRCGAGGILGTPPADLPWNLIKMPHSSAFSTDYLQLCFQELKDEGLF